MLARLLKIWFMTSVGLILITLYWSLDITSENILFPVVFINFYLVFGLFIAVGHAIQRDNREYFSLKRLLLIAIPFSISVLVILKTIYYSYSGSFFEFSAVDSLKYHNWALEMKRYGIPDFIESFLGVGGSSADLGAIFSTYFAYLIYPSTVLLNLLNVIAGIITIVFLYKLSLYFMNYKYAYLATLAFGLSSFVPYMYSTGMKETIFTMLVVVFFEKIITYIKTSSSKSLVVAIISLLFTLYFRPAVSVFMVSSVVVGLLIYNNKSVYSLVLIGLLVTAGFYFFNDILAIKEYYYRSSETVSQRKVEQGLQPSMFNYAVSYISAGIGPLPTYFPYVGQILQSLYATGLGFRALLSVFFWLSVLKAFFLKKNLLIVLIAFVLFEMFSLALILEAFEFRLNMPHYPFIYLIAFSFLEEINEKRVGRLSIRASNIALVLIPILIIVWNYRIIM